MRSAKAQGDEEDHAPCSQLQPSLLEVLLKAICALEQQRRQARCLCCLQAGMQTNGKAVMTALGSSHEHFLRTCL